MLDGTAPLLETSKASYLQRSGALVGIVSGLGHVALASNSMFSDFHTVLSCLGSPDSTSCYTQVDNQFQSDTFKTIRAIVSSLTPIPTLLGQPNATVSLISRSLNYVLVVAGMSSSGQIQAAGDVDTMVVARSGSWPRIGVITGTVGAVQSSLGLCCVGARNLGITGLSDASGGYDFYVPIGVSGTNYANLTLTASDPITGTTLGSETVDLRGLSTATPVQVPPLTGSGAPSQQSDLSGTWSGNIQESAGACSTTGTMTWTLTQSGTALTGRVLLNATLGGTEDTCLSGPVSITGNVQGSVNGNAVTLTGNATVTFKGDSATGPLSFIATLSGNTITGTTTPGSIGSTMSGSVTHFTLTRH